MSYTPQLVKAQFSAEVKAHAILWMLRSYPSYHASLQEHPPLGSNYKKDYNMTRMVKSFLEMLAQSGYSAAMPSFGAVSSWMLQVYNVDAGKAKFDAGEQGFDWGTVGSVGASKKGEGSADEMPAPTPDSSSAEFLISTAPPPGPSAGSVVVPDMPSGALVSAVAAGGESRSPPPPDPSFTSSSLRALFGVICSVPASASSAAEFSGPSSAVGTLGALSSNNTAIDDSGSFAGTVQHHPPASQGGILPAPTRVRDLAFRLPDRQAAQEPAAFSLPLKKRKRAESATCKTDNSTGKEGGATMPSGGMKDSVDETAVSPEAGDDGKATVEGQDEGQDEDEGPADKKVASERPE